MAVVVGVTYFTDHFKVITFINSVIG